MTEHGLEVGWGKRSMNKYKVAESIVTKIIADLKSRMNSGDRWDVGDEEITRDIADKWEDIVISELDKQVRNPDAPAVIG
jgi:hypothetical protein